MIEVDLKNDEEARRADSTAREACDHDRQHSQLQGCRPKEADQMSDEQSIETKQISDEEDGEWVDVEEMDSGSNDFFKQKTAYEIMPSLVGSEMCIRDSFKPQVRSSQSSQNN